MKPLDPLRHPLTGVNLVEASAGTGKTFTITTLFLRLLLERPLAIGEILVVTYTNAATAELRSRLRTRLAAAATVFGQLESGHRAAIDDPALHVLAESSRARGTLARDGRRLTAALYAFDDAAVFTIHGFCQRVLQENAFESGVLFDAQLITDQRPLVREIVRDFWVRRLYDAAPEFVRFLREKNDLLGKLTGLALRAVALPDVPYLPRLESIPQAGDERSDPERFLRLQLELVEHARDELHRRKEDANIQYFDDLLTRLRGGLARAGGERLADAIRRRHPAALIDEFQDTDPIQYEIFRRVYAGSDAALFLIGDPKQAIYGFRGADVFTYVEAKQSVAAGHEATLLVNRRSDPRLLAAVNTVFGAARRQFVIDGIPFEPAAAADGARERVGGTLAAIPPLQFLYRRKGDHKRIDKVVGRDEVCRDVAAEIARLLASDATVDGEPVRPNHIAVLCRTNDEARRVQRYLRRLRVPTVLQTDESVLETEEAGEVQRLLDALAEPADTAALIAALSTSLIGIGADEIHRLREDAAGWDRWSERFHRWHQLWAEAGFMPAFRALLEEAEVAERLLAGADGERRMTNVLHLAEILHNAAVESRRGPLALAEWYGEVRAKEEARADAIGDAAQIRLESDDLALELVTIHRSKGLEYPIVFCPFLWDGLLRRGLDKNEFRFHDPERQLRLAVDIASPPDPAHRAQSERETLAENLRLLYVALTRARHRCVVVWGPFNDAPTSALGYLLHQPRAARDDDADALIAAAARRIAAMNDAEMLADLHQLAASSEGAIAVEELSTLAADPYRPRDDADVALRCASFARTLTLRWRTASFSALIAGGERLSQEAEEGIDRDEIDAGDAEPATLAGPSVVTLADFPAGTRAGQLLHSVFENLDFTADAAAIDAAAAAQLAEYGFEAGLREPLARAVGEILQTPLADGTGSFRLAEVAVDTRLNELEFLFPVLGMGDDQASVHSGHLAAAFAQDATGLSPAYLERVSQLGFAPLSGYLKGYVDLVFVHRERWYVVDYKSNHLGPNPHDYRAPRLLAAMEQHHYFLQYHLYAVALHRHLGARLRGYEYDTHFAGVYYLFLRGMSPHHARGNGVFFDRPPRGRIEALSELLARGAA